jgi:hypothetical protein
MGGSRQLLRRRDQLAPRDELRAHLGDLFQASLVLTGVGFDRKQVPVGLQKRLREISVLAYVIAIFVLNLCLT